MLMTLRDYRISDATHGRTWSFLVAFVITTCSLAGCGGASHGDRMPITGSVTKAGQPLDEKATIYFEPADGKAGVGASGSVMNGDFSIPAEGGPTPGLSYKVSVITAPGIPADGTPKDKIKLPRRFEKKIEIPVREAGVAQDLQIDFE
ncbi:MAG: hypothetical protein V4719_20500 [Planctomycetota bacterium]